MAVAAAFIGDACVPAGPVLASRNVAAERGGAAALDGTHHFQLREADKAAIGMTPRGLLATRYRTARYLSASDRGKCKSQDLI
jgi:hypothetical protein